MRNDDGKPHRTMETSYTYRAEVRGLDVWVYEASFGSARREPDPKDGKALRNDDGKPHRTMETSYTYRAEVRGLDVWVYEASFGSARREPDPKDGKPCAMTTENLTERWRPPTHIVRRSVGWTSGSMKPLLEAQGGSPTQKTESLAQ